ncbi:MAG: bifunctional diaminohydroxyphosphoribosylaminopyrimidine deaminase/5-amino-6-(5-phosphoribosylamino)uracil reductase RibD [Tannerellaceae bacterium]|nr:bifunctional diaminohydroxyphosphoribosylaminopyrimidine deaminase/5-amino-6-(5-phosphoribosylamino)uracil reductase RibD [Tannerellaceae bacterium]
MYSEDEKYMWRCFQLARQGLGQVAPNPMVGSVVVANGKIIGEGYHRLYGGPHAEVNAIASVKDKSLLPASTIYVNLEPCSHHGKTPPCADLIIRSGIRRVVVGSFDPFSEVSGRGVRLLREAGVEVVTGCLEKEAIELNRVFMTAHTLRRPYILLKWAQSSDCFLDYCRTDASQPPFVFSTPVSSQLIHKRRSEVQAILVGTRTALLDNPSLTVRSWSGESPVRVVIDKELVIPPQAHLLDGTVKTLIFTKYERKKENNIEYIPIDFNGYVIETILHHLFERKIHSLMVEGGSHTLTSFLQAGLWDEIQIEKSAVCLQNGVEAPAVNLFLQENEYKIKESGDFVCYVKSMNSF